MSTSEAHIFEIFSSFQGEGPFIGERQIFIRFLLCNMACAYCDTPESLLPQKTYRVEETPGKRDFKHYNNPVTLDQLMSHVDLFNKQKKLHHSVSITGGEPLLQVDFLNNFLPKLKDNGLRVYLETNGTMADRMSEVVDNVDMIAMDIKLPSVTKESDKLPEHRKFLALVKAKETFIKIICGKETKPMEIEDAAKMVAEIDPGLPVILQPLTPTKTIKHGPTPDQLILFHTIAKRHLASVRVIPQVHKVMGQL